MDRLRFAKKEMRNITAHIHVNNMLMLKEKTCVAP